MTRAIALGAAVVVAVGVPAVLVGSLALDDGSNLVFPLAAVVLAAFAAGGWLAGHQITRHQVTRLHLAAGAGAALAGYAATQVVSVPVQLAQDEDVRAAVVASNAVLAAVFGLAGAAGARR